MSSIYNTPDQLLPMRYRIREGTNNEFVAAGSDGNILRWKETSEPSQEWLFQPMGKGRYHIITCQTTRTNERMAVGSTGNVVVWTPKEEESQYFKLERIPSTDKFRFMEFTRNEYVAVGRNGNILRYALNPNQESFNFRIEPVGLPPTPPALTPGQYEPDQIPIFPRLQSYDITPPIKSPIYLIGESIVPAFHVGDHKYFSKANQYDSNPFYVLRREQYWKRQALEEYDGHSSNRKKVTVKTGISSTESTSMEDTIKMTMGASSSFKFAPEIGFDGLSLKGPENSQSFTSELSKELKMTTSSSTTVMEERTEEQELHFKEGTRAVIALWTLVDSFTLFGMDKHRVVKKWTVTRPNVVRRDAYPALNEE